MSPPGPVSRPGSHCSCCGSQSETGGCALNFGPRGNSVVTIPRERLQAGVEYTFNLTVWKAGRKEESTNQTVGATGPWPYTSKVEPSARAGGGGWGRCQEGLRVQGHLLQISPNTFFKGFLGVSASRSCQFSSKLLLLIQILFNKTSRFHIASF